MAKAKAADIAAALGLIWVGGLVAEGLHSLHSTGGHHLIGAVLAIEIVTAVGGAALVAWITTNHGGGPRKIHTMASTRQVMADDDEQPGPDLRRKLKRR